MRLPDTSEMVIYFACIVLVGLVGLVSTSYFKVANCKQEGGFWVEGQCNYGLESGGSVRQVRK